MSSQNICFVLFTCLETGPSNRNINDDTRREPYNYHNYLKSSAAPAMNKLTKMKNRRKQPLSTHQSMVLNTTTSHKQNSITNDESTKVGDSSNELSTKQEITPFVSTSNTIIDPMEQTIISDVDSTIIVDHVNENGKRMIETTNENISDVQTDGIVIHPNEDVNDKDFIHPKKFCVIPEQNPPPAIDIQNKFQVLSEINSVSTNNSVSPISSVQKTDLSLPTIYLYNVVNRYNLIKQILSMCQGKPKILNLRYTIKLKCFNKDDHTRLLNFLQRTGTEYSTDTARMDTPIKVVIRNLPSDTPVNDIKEALILDDVPCTEVKQLHSVDSQTKQRMDLPLFLVYIKRHENATRIYNLNSLLYYRIRVEPYKSRDIIQCYKCQRFNHTEKTCHANPRCVKCAGEHITRQCTRTLTDVNLKCANCKGNHTANFRGCPIYLQAKGIKSQNSKQINDTTKPIVSSTNQVKTNQVLNRNDFPQLEAKNRLPEGFTKTWKTSSQEQSKICTDAEPNSLITDTTSLTTIKDILTIIKELNLRNKLDIIKNFLIKYKSAKDAIEKFTILLECTFTLIDNGSM